MIGDMDLKQMLKTCSVQGSEDASKDWGVVMHKLRSDNSFSRTLSPIKLKFVMLYNSSNL